MKRLGGALAAALAAGLVIWLLVRHQTEPAPVALAQDQAAKPVSPLTLAPAPPRALTVAVDAGLIGPTAGEPARVPTTCTHAVTHERPAELAGWTELTIVPPDRDAEPAGGQLRLLGQGEAEDWALPSWHVYLRLCDPTTIVVRANAGEGSVIANPEVASVTLHLAPAPARVVLHGTLVRRDGRPVSGARMRVPGDSTETDDAGQFELASAAVDDPVVVAVGGAWVFANGASEIEVKRSSSRIALGTLEVTSLSLVPAGKIGIGWNTKASEPTVAEVFPNSPAEHAGLKPGDVLLEVDGHAIASPDEGVRLIPGEPGSALRLKVRRGADIFLVDLRREVADADDLRASMRERLESSHRRSDPMPPEPEP
ncbi:MAG: PDZ domain-containing protein [Myxococcaceae bacterium]|nr:PDZ domain-containing protein [Myxococcaceae bacterium]